ncbi:hypothetical protein FIU82_02025 [Pseudoalteromonas sp. THAF3]|uniref:hypothetical protein n=1 Tax=Pseudoalteromonas TaxID=53246 RepID=UPI001107DE33|nr:MULTISPECIES: hypothetical protein [Pseudoalteromonas]QFU03794.1 hypothetical protein FIU82_02025 [Pseudoalteromonas sp. THAF3]TLX51302.1 hypothetical protein CWC31_06710 [Pseudoalteromonas ruthenica]|tara:strand:- start:19173 stop:19508 length:336 start_codon:yes stop_codon:yes gene_type:complete
MDAEQVQQRIRFLLHGCDHAYREYLQHNKAYAYAHALYSYNQQLNTLIMELGHQLDEPAQQAALRLSLHINIWSQQWRELQQSLKPTLEQPFVFNSIHPLPADAKTYFFSS